MAAAWAQRQREFQAQVVLGAAPDLAVDVYGFTSWELGEHDESTRPVWLFVAAQVVMLAAVSVAVGLTVGLVAGAEWAATTALALFVAVGMVRVFTAILGQHGPPSQVTLTAGCHVVIEADSEVVVIPVSCADRRRLGDEGEVTLVGRCGPGANLGFVLGDQMVWPIGPPVSVA